jgi:hypothetical protein
MFGLAVLGLAMSALALLDLRAAVAHVARTERARVSGKGATSTSSKSSSTSGKKGTGPTDTHTAEVLEQLSREVDGGIGGALGYGSFMGALGVLLAILATWGNHRLPRDPTSLVPHLVRRALDAVARSPFLSGRLIVLLLVPLLALSAAGAIVAVWPRSRQRDDKGSHAKVD